MWVVITLLDGRSRYVAGKMRTVDTLRTHNTSTIENNCSCVWLSGIWLGHSHFIHNKLITSIWIEEGSDFTSPVG